MKILTTIIICALIAAALLPSSMPYGVTAFLNGLCIGGACVLSYSLGSLK